MGRLRLGDAEGSEVEAPFEDRLGDGAERAHLRRGEPAQAQIGVRRIANGARVQYRRKPRLEPTEDRVGARRRDLLGDDDRGEAGKPRLAAAQARHRAGSMQFRHERRVERGEGAERFDEGRLVGEERRRGGRARLPSRGDDC